jgi:hypothetical protein
MWLENTYIFPPFLAVVFASVYSATVSSMDIRLKDECHKRLRYFCTSLKLWGIPTITERLSLWHAQSFQNNVKHTLDAHTTQMWSASFSGCLNPKTSSQYSFRGRLRNLQTLPGHGVDNKNSCRELNSGRPSQTGFWRGWLTSATP